MLKPLFAYLRCVCGLLLLVSSQPAWGADDPSDCGNTPPWEWPAINMDEAKVASYTLPDPLEFANGKPVENAGDWRERRTEILALFESEVYGRTPDWPGEVTLQSTVKPVDRNALDGLATRKEVSLVFTYGERQLKLSLLIYLPNETEGPVPLFVGLNFFGNHTAHPDPQITQATGHTINKPDIDVTDNRASSAARGVFHYRWPAEKLIARGYGLATLFCGDSDPDFDDGFENGVHPLFYKSGQTRPKSDEWGTIGAWAWSLSRAMDYFETDPQIAAGRVAVIGHSRMGKAALWAGAQDERFAMVISNNSGCTGAALAQRRFGETVKAVNCYFPYWCCENYKKYNDAETTLPVDQHQLLALIAPRPVYVASASEDRWADPKGEFLAVFHAEPVYQLLGEQGLGVERMPKENQPVMRTIGYHLRRGKHDVTDFDWDCYLEFADRHLKEPR